MPISLQAAINTASGDLMPFQVRNASLKACITAEIYCLPLAIERLRSFP
ncbi:hypothetical protein WKK05_12280 [Nostoc sp. UHCC 0302]